MMASTNVRVHFEVGHEATLRNKRTPEGFTHDWEVYIRGADNTEIQHFVDKVVFHLHETFPKPNRVVKNPPYSVRECGYAGFIIPIDVFLKNIEEPRKITFVYDMHLQTSGPPISRVIREPRMFQNPNEDFRRKLIRGGGVGVDSPLEAGGKKPTQSPKKPEDGKAAAAKKHKPDLPANNSFAALFGTPIRRVTPEPKKAVEISKKIEVDKKKISKSSVKEERDYKEKERDKAKEKEKLKEKSKRPSSPLPPPPKPKDEIKRSSDERDKKKEDTSKGEKDKKGKHRGKEPEIIYKKDKKLKESDLPKKPYVPVVEKSAPIPSEVEMTKEKSEKEKHKHKHKKKEKEKSREKEKKKHKSKNETDLKDKVKKKEEINGKLEKRSRSRSRSRSPSPVREKRRGALGALFSELSDSSLSDDDDDPLPPARILPQPSRLVPEIKLTPPEISKPSKEKDEKKSKSLKSEETNLLKVKKEKSPRKRSSKLESDLDTKRPKIDRERSLSLEREREEELLRKQQEEQERIEKEREEEERRIRELEEEQARKEREAAEAALKTKAAKERKSKRDKTVEEPKPEEPPRVELTKEYLAQLRDLQQRIMTLEDNTELQQVVKVIAESGQYVITKKTFDFDLCTLDHTTVRRLQQFFASST